MALATTPNRNYPIVDDAPTSYLDTVIIPGLASLANMVDADIASILTSVAGKVNTSAIDTDGTLAANSDAKIATQKATKTYVGAYAQPLDARLSAIVATGITAAMFATNVVDTDATLAANSASRIPAQSAVKSYVDNAITGVFWKPAVDVATTGNITLSGEQTIDGVLTSASRVLVRAQTTQTQNGIYLTAAGSWTRVSDADTGFELWGATVMVKRGTLYANTQWTNSNATQPTIGSTNITFSQISGAGTYSATGGVVLTGNQFSADTGTSGHKLPWLDGANTFSATQTFAGSLPQIQWRNSANDTTDKYGQLVAVQYASTAESEGFSVLASEANSSNNIVYVGGGFSGQNAATSIRFSAAANTSTRIGTTVATITTSGLTVNELVTINRASIPLQLNNSGGGSQMAVFYQGANKRSSIGADATNALYVFDQNDIQRLTVSQLGSMRLNGNNSGTSGGASYVWDVGGSAAAAMGHRSNIAGGSYDTTFCLYLAVGTAFAPFGDNVYSIGNSTYRWSTIYAATGTINTSDMREKTAFTHANDNERAFIRDVFMGAGWYQWLAAVEEKGKAARTHYGLGAQNVEKIARDHGIDPNSRAFFCEDEVKHEGKKKFTRKGLRHDQLHTLGIAALFKEVADLRAEIETLRKAA